MLKGKSRKTGPHACFWGSKVLLALNHTTTTQQAREEKRQEWKERKGKERKKLRRNKRAHTFVGKYRRSCFNRCTKNKKEVNAHASVGTKNEQVVHAYGLSESLEMVKKVRTTTTRTCGRMGRQEELLPPNQQKQK
ncbi:unnamed protein product [Ectocarpus sp. 12 AP-2014]